MFHVEQSAGSSAKMFHVEQSARLSAKMFRVERLAGSSAECSTWNILLGGRKKGDSSSAGMNCLTHISPGGQSYSAFNL